MSAPTNDLRGFRWPLRPLERKLDAELEAARLALARMQSQEQVARQSLGAAAEHLGLQQGMASRCIQHDPRLAHEVLSYLSGLEQALSRCRSDAARVAQDLVDARVRCIERQRRLACVEALRERAEQAHLRERTRREAREADAAWLAHSQFARSAGTREGGSR